MFSMHTACLAQAGTEVAAEEELEAEEVKTQVSGRGTCKFSHCSMLCLLASPSHTRGVT